MATTRMNNNVLQVARRLNDPRTDPSSSGDTGAVYTSAILAGYIHQAMRDILKDWYVKGGETLVASMFPELIKTSSALTLTAGSVAVPSEAWLVLTLRVSAGTREFRPLTDLRDINRAITGEHAFVRPISTKPYFYVQNGTIKTLGITTGDVLAQYLIHPPEVTIVTSTGGTDILMAAIWDGEIVDRAVAKGVADQKHAIAVTMGG